jgi:hypothetical protein
LLYIALWCEADREGRLSWKPKTFKIRYFPADECNIDAMCAEILVRKMVILYGDGLAYIPSFLIHQHINPRESASNLIDPESTRGLRVIDASARVSDVQGGRKEGKECNDASFDTFYSAYPRKVSKPDARKAWDKLKPDDALLEAVLKGLENARAQDHRFRGETKFIPHPASWLNSRGWEDFHDGGGFDDLLVGAT